MASMNLTNIAWDTLIHLPSWWVRSWQLSVVFWPHSRALPVRAPKL